MTAPDLLHSTLDLSDGSLAYDIRGAGPLILCLPGMGDRRQAYDGVAATLSASGYRVATMDLRGHGESSTGWSVYTQSAIAGDAVALIESLGGDGPVVVIGQSYTPDSAREVAVRMPERVAAVIAVSPWAETPRAAVPVRVLMDLLLRIPSFWPRYYRSLVRGRVPAGLATHLSALRAALRRRGGTAAIRAMIDPVSKDAESARTAAAVPALVLMGELDPDFPDPRAAADTYAAGLAGSAEVVMIPDTGHYPHLQDPAAVSSVIREFLTRVGVAPERTVPDA